MKTLFAANSFQKDLKCAVKRGKSAVKLQAILDILLSEQTLSPRYRPHKLSG